MVVLHHGSTFWSAMSQLLKRAASEGDAAVFVERLEPLGQRLAGGTLAGAFADRVVGFALDFHCGQGSCAQSLQGSSASTSPMMVNCSV